MNVKVLFFAGLRDSVGAAEINHDVGSAPATVRKLRAQLGNLHPDLTLDSVRVAVNEEFVNDHHLLAEADLVAFIPPVSGG